MKTRKTFAFIFLPLMVLSSCQYKSDDDMAKEEYISVVNRILENKIDELKSLFACNISSKIIRFQDQVIELINYVTGEYISSKYTGTGAQYMIDDFKQVRFLPMAACELYTTDSKYYFSVLYCSIDDFDAGNVGIWNLMVQKCKGENDAFIPYSSYEDWKDSDKYRGITLI
ncbi:MAG: DUF5104 domain-containing protein [Erysipelotrichaceae bacterium]|nr:DUF5104 domain-containing protein [Erysipelotrichaceae bacterium]